jgi:hypothetical protein
MARGYQNNLSPLLCTIMLASNNTQFITITNPESRRGQLWQEALVQCGLSPAKLISYADLLEQKIHLTKYDTKNTIFRFESPERSFAVDRGFIAAGAAIETTGPHQNQPQRSHQVNNRFGKNLVSAAMVFGLAILFTDLDS